VIHANQIDGWIRGEEDEHLEFKEAKMSFDFSDLTDYCAALANEGGGHLLLGVTDKQPRQVVGSGAFPNLGKVRQGLLQRLHLRVDAEQVSHPDGRVVVFSVPSRPIGLAIQVKGRYLMRSGEGLTAMTPDMLQRIFAEAGPDFSAEICSEADLGCLDATAIADFRRRWAKKTNNPSIERMGDRQALRDAELLLDDGLTYAALILFGTRKALGRFLPQAEVVFEYRSTEATGPAQQRIEFRQGFYSFYEELWQAIATRNDLQHYQEGLFVWDVPTFDESVVREVLLNALAHRDYRHQGSIFVRQLPRKLEVTSPGGLPPGITVDNILWRQQPRNRRICDAFRLSGLVERSGQGMNRIYETSIKQSKQLPDFSGTDDYQVNLTLHGLVEDVRLLAFLEQVGKEKLASFTTQHFLTVNYVHRDLPVPDFLQEASKKLLDLGVLERSGRKRLLLSRRYYRFVRRSGEYTRRRGLDHETNKELLLRHIRIAGSAGARMAELLQVLPSKSRMQIKGMLMELRDAGRIHMTGRTRGARWASGSTDGSPFGSTTDGESKR
jgi:ATP-dependent DNA helicase RecG